MKSEHNWILHFLWNILGFVCLEAQMFKGKGTFSWRIPIHLGLWVHTLCSGADYYSGKGQYVSCARKELSGLVPHDTMKINFLAVSDLLQSCTTRQYVIDLRRFGSLNLHFTFHLWTVCSACVCACSTPQRLLQSTSQHHKNREFIKWQIALCNNN